MDCVVCKGRGWIISSRDDGRDAVERCDTCWKLKDDLEAAAKARWCKCTTLLEKCQQLIRYHKSGSHPGLSRFLSPGGTDTIFTKQLHTAIAEVEKVKNATEETMKIFPMENHSQEQQGKKVQCKFCNKEVPSKTAHLIDDGWVGECCWDERLRS